MLLIHKDNIDFCVLILCLEVLADSLMNCGGPLVDYEMTTSVNLAYANEAKCALLLAGRPRPPPLPSLLAASVVTLKGSGENRHP